MKTSLLMSMLVVIVIIGLGFFLIRGRSPRNTSKSEFNPISGSMSEKPAFGPSSSPTYQESAYVFDASTALAKPSSSRRVLFFYANWCPTCKEANKNFTDNESLIPNDVVLIRVNYNDSETDQSEKDLAKKYGITYQHTFVQIDPQGNEIGKWNGGDIEELRNNLK